VALLAAGIVLVSVALACAIVLIPGVRGANLVGTWVHFERPPSGVQMVMLMVATDWVSDEEIELGFLGHTTVRHYTTGRGDPMPIGAGSGRWTLVRNDGDSMLVEFEQGGRTWRSIITLQDDNTIRVREENEPMSKARTFLREP
jgi:hypothetical protein